MMSLFMYLAAAAVGTAAPAAVQANDGSQTPKPKKERKICRSQIRSGSNFSTRVCKTRAEWAGLDADFDGTSEVLVPGNKASTGREVNRGSTTGRTMGTPR